MASFLLRQPAVASPSGFSGRSNWAAVAGALIGGLYLGHAWIFGNYVADDAGISLAYARNVVAGFGPVLYAGGEAVEGYSNPLWTALLAVAAAAGLDGADGVPLLKGLGLAFGGATILLSAGAARTAFPSGTRISWFAPALLASLTPFVFWTAAGLENGLYAFLLLLAVVLHLRELQDRTKPQWSALALAGVALTRPEGIAYFAVFLLHRVLFGARGRRLAVWASVVVLIYAAFLLSRLLIFGDWLPNTYYAKVGIYDRHLYRLLDYLRTPDDRGSSYLRGFAESMWPLLFLAGIGLADWRDRRATLLIAGLLGGTALYAVYVGGDFWPAGRFFTAMLPLVAIAAQHSLDRFGPKQGIALTAAAALIVGVALNRSLAASGDLRVRHDGDVLISLQGRLAQAHRLQALAAALGIKDPLVLDPDIGGPALAGLRVLDLGGLTDIHIARFHYFPAFFRSYVFEERRPDFIRTHDSWTVSSGITAFPEFAQQYVAVSSRRDARGLHGEFIRKDLLEHRAAHPQPAPARLPSFRQAVEDGRARRRHEAERARRHRETSGLASDRAGQQ